MNRLQKKCFIASAGIHLLLALILLIGPAFVSHQSKQDDLPILDFVPAKTVDALVSGGGNPMARPQPATPVPQPQVQPAAVAPPPQPAPQPAMVREPDPPKEAKPVKPEVESLEPAKQRQPHQVEISTTLVTRKPADASDRKAKAEAQAKDEARALAVARSRAARKFSRAADQLGSELSSGISIEDMRGPGGGGVPYANWKQAVKTVYDDAWLLPDGAMNDEATTVASVTIARDGTVVSAQIIRRSGDPVVDHSVQATLDRVRVAPPFPEDSKEDQRTVTINFNAKAKRSLG